MAQINNCLITGQPIENFKEFPGGFEYNVNYNSFRFVLKFAANVQWEDIISGHIQLMLRAMLYNNEWPIDPDAIITSQLIQKINGYGIYPHENDFDAKKLRYLEWAYNNGGEKYMPIKFKRENYLIAFAKDEDEFLGVYKALLGDMDITHNLTPLFHCKLTPCS